MLEIWQYNTVKHNIILNAAIQWPLQDLDHTFELTVDTPWLTLLGKLWGVYGEYFFFKWQL